MFREELHTAFDNISPSPELLDRVSAMMNEEVRRKKAPLKLNVVKYGGIAAALALAAGGTFLVLNNQNGGIKTSETADMAIRAENAAITAAKDDYRGLAGAEEQAHTYTIVQNAANTSAENDENACESENAGEAPAETQAMGIMASQPEKADSDNTENESADNAAADQDEKKDAASEQKNAVAPAAADAVPAADNGVSAAGEEGSEKSDEAPAAPAVADERSAESAVNPATGIMALDPFHDLRSWSLSIPDQLLDLVEGVRTVSDDETIYGEKWREYVNAVMYTNGTTTIEDELNIYTFIKYFNVPIEEARKALYNAADTKTGVPNITLTREEADIILTMDVEKITAVFANPYAIVKGKNIYSPAWLIERSYDDYRAAGITKDDIREKYGLISAMADTFSDAVIDKDIQAELNKKLEEYLNS